MPCHAAILEDKTSVAPETTVKQAFALLKKKKTEFLAVVDGDNVLLGYFSAGTLLRNIVPVAVDLQSGVQLDTVIGAAPGVAKRYKNALAAPVSQFYDRHTRCVYNETPVWEGLKVLIEHGAPLFVVEEESRKYCGLITEQSALEALQDLQE